MEALIVSEVFPKFTFTNAISENPSGTVSLCKDVVPGKMKV